MPRDLNKIIAKHAGCPVRFEQRGPHTGMWCARHGVWLKWISKADQAKIADLLPIR